MKKIILPIALLGASNAYAGDNYFGAGFGQMKAEIERANYVGVNEEIKDTSGSYRLFAGLTEAASNTTIEFSYVDIGEFRQTLDDGIDRLEGIFEGNLVSAALVGKAPVNNNGAFVFQGGLFRWSLETTVNLTGATFGSLSASESESGFDVMFGIGYEQKLDNVGVRAEWIRYNSVGNDNTGGDSNLDLISLALFIPFN